MEKKIIISVGGTGGHVYPAQSLAHQLFRIHPKLKILFVGGGLGTNRHFNQEQFPFKEVPCATFASKNPITCLRSATRIISGTFKSSTIITQFKPDLVVGFGSYHSLPLLLAAKLTRIPIVLHEANAIPGKVNRLMSTSAIFTAIHFPQAASLLKGLTLLAKMPLRQEYTNAQNTIETKQKARKHFTLDLELTTILVFGGSQGAQGLNDVFLETAQYLCKKGQKSIQIIHLTGNPKATLNIIQTYEKLNIRACVKDFETQMHLAWSAADLVIGRAGASTIAEQIEFEIPGILIPYPHATDNHQEENALFMVDQIRGALLCKEKNITSISLGDTICALFANEFELLKQMKHSIQKYKQQERRNEFSELIIDVLAQKKQRLGKIYD